MRKPLATSVLAVIAVVVTAVALTAVDASFASNGPRAALDTELRAVPTSDSASPAGRRAAPQALDFDVATNDARRTTRRAARTALALTVQDEEGRTVRGLELQRRAADAPEWEPIPSGAFELREDGAELVLAEAAVEGAEVRVGAAWHQWAEVDVGAGDATVVLRRAGSLHVRVRGGEPKTLVSVLARGAGRERRAATSLDSPASFERLAPGAYELLVETDRSSREPASVEVEVVAGHTTRAFLDGPQPNDGRRGALEVTLASVDLRLCAESLRLVMDLRTGSPSYAVSKESPDMRREIEGALGDMWTTTYLALRPGPYTVHVEPLGVTRDVRVEAEGSTRLRIDLGPIARTSVTFFDPRSGAQVVPRSVLGTLTTPEGRALVQPIASTDGSGAFVFWSAPGELGVGLEDPAWSARVRGVDVRAGWNALVVEVERCARLRLRAEPGQVELPNSFWSRIEAHRADGSLIACGRSLQRLGAGAQRGVVLELVLPAEEPIDVTTPETAECAAQTLRVALSAGQTAERTIAAIR